MALKTTDPSLRHRLDLGGVRLDIEDADSLRRNMLQMRRALAPYGSTLPWRCSRMAPVGQACTFRAIEDPLLGPVISFGLAGDAVNLLDDWAHRVPPLSAADVTDFIRGTAGRPEAVRLPGPAGRGRRGPGGSGRPAGLAEGQPSGDRAGGIQPGPLRRPGPAILAADVRIGNAARRTDSARRAMLG